LPAQSPGARRLAGAGGGLTPEDKALILDAQALQLRGTALKLRGRLDEAGAAFQQALAGMDMARAGRIAATAWMRAQTHGELGAVAEARGDMAEAERQHRAAVALLETTYPGSAALLSAKSQLAAFHARRGQSAQARELYRDVVKANAENGNSSPTFRRGLALYFALLAARPDDPEAAAEMFEAGQVLVRPGAARTQAVLARELSGGSDEAARLFRQAVTLGRDVERARIELARLEAQSELRQEDEAAAQLLRANLAQLQTDQVATQAMLAAYPRYRAVSREVLNLNGLQALLGEGEAYYRMIVAGGDVFALMATRDSTRVARTGLTEAGLDRAVDRLRGTISTIEDGQLVTYPFDLETAHTLYRALFAPFEDRMADLRHLIFEPDGAMLRLPPNVLVTDALGVAAYRAVAARPGNDGFDFTGVAWLGRDREISTAISAQAFHDLRRAPPSRARSAYIGFGENVPAEGFFLPSTGVRASTPADDGCGWSLAAWNRPISAAELHVAGRAVGDGRAAILTGAAFTDTAIKARDDLADYRILHFATHGLVAPPRPECPARPALMTSFGDSDSDGLLSFAEIFDLRLDADLVILSACDTAGRASAVAAREAGIAAGDDFAFDGLVRAFIGAGGRLVLASHWPVPDDFDATQRLVSGLFAQDPGTGTAEALRRAQLTLMDDPLTSHPYYWAGFAVVGDGMTPVVRQEAEVLAAR
jgi:CHAT domain-containing protein